MAKAKTYFFDTSALIDNPDLVSDCLLAGTIVITDTVLTELDGLKDSQNYETAYAARRALRFLGQALIDCHGSKLEVKLQKDKTLLFAQIDEENLKEFSHLWNKKKGADLILQTMIQLMEKEKTEAILVSSDIGFLGRAKKAGFGILLTSQVPVQENKYLGWRELLCPHDLYQEFSGSEDSVLELKNLFYLNKKGKKVKPELVVNTFILLKDDQASHLSCLAVYDGEKVIRLQKKVNPYGLKAKNLEQKFAINALLPPLNQERIIILKGGAGTGKTLLALACGLQLREERRCDSIVVTRPNVRSGKGLGFLPGDQDAKYQPLMRPIFDNMKELSVFKNFKTPTSMEGLRSFGIDPVPLEDLRGASIANSFIIVDEAQNCTIEQIKMVVTRVALKSSIALCGDPTQSDLGYYKYNGLTYASEKFKGSPLCWQMYFKPSSLRSKIAEAGTVLL